MRIGDKIDGRKVKAEKDYKSPGLKHPGHTVGMMQESRDIQIPTNAGTFAVRSKINHPEPKSICGEKGLAHGVKFLNAQTHKARGGKR